MEFRFVRAWALTLMTGLAVLTQAQAAGSELGRPWGLSDVSILYPIPESPSAANDLISPQERGVGGALLPYELYSRLPAIDHGEPIDRTYQALRVVAVRLDPCFLSDGRCLSQVRLVWQPVGPAVYGSTAPLGALEAKDAAIHTLYTLPAARFKALLSDYAALVREANMDLSSLPLQVHPVLLKQGLRGTFATRLRSLVLEYVGWANLWRVTAMQSLPGDDDWSFSGINVRNGVAQDLSIPRIGSHVQRIEVAQLNRTSFANGRVHPLPDEPEDNFLPDILRERSMNRVPKSAEDLAIAIANVENPMKNTPETVDCVSCHAAQPAGTLLHRTLSSLHDDADVRAHVFQSALPLRNSGPHLADTHILRAFGYADRDPVISRRAINESAHVVTELNGSTAVRVAGN